MATPTILIEQATRDAGSVDVSRDDLVLAQLVTLTDPANGVGDYLWVLEDRPVGSSATLADAGTDTATFTPDVTGSYLVRCTFDGGATSTLIGAVVTVNRNFRIPAAGEKLEFGADGWHPTMDEVLRGVDASGGSGAGLNRQYVSFVRSDDADEASISDAAQTGLGITDDITIEARVRFADAGFDLYLVSKLGSYEMGILTEGSLKFSYLVLPGGPVEVTQSPAEAFELDRWYDLAISRRKATGLVSFYVDGVLEGSTVSNAGVGMDLWTDPFTLGGYNPGGPNLHFDGDLAEVRVWNRVKTNAEIAANRFVQLNGGEAGLKGHWKLNGVWEDATANNNTLIPASAPVFSVVPTDLPPTHEAIVLESGVLGKPSVSAGPDDPSSGGLVAYEGSLFSRFVATAGELWAKIGAANTAWAQVALLGVTNTFLKAQGTALVTLTDEEFILTNAADGNVFKVTLGDDRTLDPPTNLVAGFTYIWIIVQDDPGGRVLTFDSIFDFEGGTAPTLTTAVAAVDIITGVYDGTSLRCGFLLDEK